jgi:hypothetical protein
MASGDLADWQRSLGYLPRISFAGITTGKAQYSLQRQRTWRLGSEEINYMVYLQQWQRSATEFSQRIYRH